MANTSATGGYLTPAPLQPMDDAALLDFMQQVIVGITGITGTLVRPAFQPDPPKRPKISVDWCAFYITNGKPEAGHVYNVTAQDGLSTETTRHEYFEMRCSFYGPNSGYNASRWRDGLEISQNREVMFLSGVSFTESSGTTKLGELVDQQWFQRTDITSRFMRKISRTYEVLSILRVTGQIITETETIDWAAGPEV